MMTAVDRAAVAGEWGVVSAHVAAVRSASPAPVVLKVIIESASGGIRDAAAALAMIEAGATRIGASASAAILGGV